MDPRTSIPTQVADFLSEFLGTIHVTWQEESLPVFRIWLSEFGIASGAQLVS